MTVSNGVVATRLSAQLLLPPGPVGDTMRMLLEDAETGMLPPPRLLGMFDPVLHGWSDRSFVTGADKEVVTANGMFRATALVDAASPGLGPCPAAW